MSETKLGLNKQDKTKTSTRATTQTAAVETSNIKIQQLFKVMVDHSASDLHLSVGTSPGMRVHGEIVRVNVGSLKPEDTKRLAEIA